MLSLWCGFFLQALCLAWAMLGAFPVGAPIVHSKLGAAFPRLRLSVQDLANPLGSLALLLGFRPVSLLIVEMSVFQCAFVSASGVDSFGLSVPAVGPGRGWAPLVAGRGSSPWVGPHPSSPAVGPGRGWAPTFRRRPWVPGVGGHPSAAAGRGSRCSLPPPAVGPAAPWRRRPCVFVCHNGSFCATISIRRI